jgi:hypothetical protein
MRGAAYITAWSGNASGKIEVRTAAVQRVKAGAARIDGLLNPPPPQAPASGGGDRLRNRRLQVEAIQVEAIQDGRVGLPQLRRVPW